MANRKKPASKSKSKAAAGRSTVTFKQPPQTVDSVTVRLTVICFTVLCIVFASLAFWRYG